MVKTTPKVRNRQLFCYANPTPICEVDSPTWFAWLETATTFRYFSNQRHDWYRGMARCLRRFRFARSVGGGFGCGMRTAVCIGFCISGMWVSQMD